MISVEFKQNAPYIGELFKSISPFPLLFKSQICPADLTLCALLFCTFAKMSAPSF